MGRVLMAESSRCGGSVKSGCRRHFWRGLKGDTAIVTVVEQPDQSGWGRILRGKSGYCRMRDGMSATARIMPGTIMDISIRSRVMFCRGPYPGTNNVLVSAVVFAHTSAYNVLSSPATHATSLAIAIGLYPSPPAVLQRAKLHSNI